jgi:hypothetical protein
MAVRPGSRDAGPEGKSSQGERDIPESSGSELVATGCGMIHRAPFVPGGLFFLVQKTVCFLNGPDALVMPIVAQCEPCCLWAGPFFAGLKARVTLTLPSLLHRDAKEKDIWNHRFPRHPGRPRWRAELSTMTI